MTIRTLSEQVLDNIHDRVDEILRMIGEPMSDGRYLASGDAHQLEDEVVHYFVRCCALRGDMTGRCARELLRVVDLKNYERWFA